MPIPSEMRSIRDPLPELDDLIARIPAIPYLARAGAIRFGPQVREVFGHPPEAFLDDDALWPGLIHPNDRDAFAGEADDGAARRVVTYRARIADGSYRCFRDESVAAPGGDGD